MNPLMAKGKGKFFAVWCLLAAATLYLPFQGYLSSKGYTNSEDFFEDLLFWITIVAIFVVPIALIYALLFRQRTEKKRK